MNTEAYSLAERQLITCMAWFRSRYALFMGLALDRKADKESIEAFGSAWIGLHKQNWDLAFGSLCEKKLLQFSQGEYALTELGLQLKEQLDLDAPFYKYEYDNYFLLEKKSKAHAAFCEKVYGADLSQHGLIDQQELGVLLQHLQANGAQKLLDIGCGNGRITEYIADIGPRACLGIDISSEAIQSARQRTAAKAYLRFELGNLNQLALAERFDAIFFLDTLYYANQLKDTLLQAKALLQEGGKIYAYFSQWIMDEAYAENLKAENTHLAKALKELGLSFTWVDLSDSGKRHWKSKWNTLLAMKEDFVQEGHLSLWEYREREAQRYANWGDAKYARYFYEIG